MYYHSAKVHWLMSMHLSTWVILKINILLFFSNEGYRKKVVFKLSFISTKIKDFKNFEKYFPK